MTRFSILDLVPVREGGSVATALADAAAYAARLTAAGTPARAVTEPGLVHGYLRARATVPRAAASFDRITRTLSAMAQGTWPEPEETA